MLVVLYRLVIALSNAIVIRKFGYDWPAQALPLNAASGHRAGRDVGAMLESSIIDDFLIVWIVNRDLRYFYLLYKIWTVRL